MCADFNVWKSCCLYIFMNNFTIVYHEILWQLVLVILFSQAAFSCAVYEFMDKKNSNALERVGKGQPAWKWAHNIKGTLDMKVHVARELTKDWEPFLQTVFRDMFCKWLTTWWWYLIIQNYQTASRFPLPIFPWI